MIIPLQHYKTLMYFETDLDTITSSIAFAWVAQELTVALIQVERADLNLRAGNLYALSLAGLSETQDELTLTELVDLPFPSQTFVLVDHNRLGSLFTLDNPKAEPLR